MTGRRRGWKDGGIQELPSGKFKARFSYTDTQGRRHRPTQYFDTLSGAREWLAEQRSNKNKGHAPVSGKVKLEQMLQAWLDGKKPSVDPNTWKRYERSVRLHLKPKIGRYLLAKLSKAHIIQLHTDLTAEKVSASEQRKVATVLRMVLKEALEDGLIPNNPATRVKKPKTERHRIEVWNADEVRQFLDAAQMDRLSALFVLAADSGARQGEILALRWPDVDWKTGSVFISQSLEEFDGRFRLKDVKTKESRRRVRLTPATMDALQAHRERMRLEKHDVAEGLVFCDTAGEFLAKPNFYRRNFLPTMRRAGVKQIRFHDVRHTSATLLLMSGAAIKAVSARLGHAKVTQTLDTYAGFLPEMDDRILMTMQKVLCEKGTKEGTKKAV